MFYAKKIRANRVLHNEGLASSIFLSKHKCLKNSSSAKVEIYLKLKYKYILIWYMEKAMAPHSSTLAWKIPWMEEPGRLQSMGSLRVRHDWVTSLSLSCIGGGNGNPFQCSCLENPKDGGALWTAVYGVTQSWTRLNRLSSSSSNNLIWGKILLTSVQSLSHV